MKTPTIHMNGTPPDRLRDQYYRAAEAIDAALDAIRQIEFHARDYYVQGDGAFDQAQREHRARIEALHGIRDDYLEIGKSVRQQMRERDRRLESGLDVKSALAHASVAEDAARQQAPTPAPEAPSAGLHM